MHIEARGITAEIFRIPSRLSDGGVGGNVPIFLIIWRRFRYVPSTTVLLGGVSGNAGDTAVGMLCVRIEYATT